MNDPIVADRLTGMSYHAIARKHGVSPFTARYRAKVAMERGEVTAEQIRHGRLVEKRTAIVVPSAEWAKAAAAKIMDNCYLEDGECWPWLFGKNTLGYGTTNFRGKRYIAHRLMYAAAHGGLPSRAVVRHRCDKPACCNPDHLELGTDRDNSQDARRRSKFAGQLKTHCKRGHELTPENLTPRADGLRHCKRCDIVRNRIKEGWPADLAESIGRVPMGYRWQDVVSGRVSDRGAHSADERR